MGFREKVSAGDMLNSVRGVSVSTKKWCQESLVLSICGGPQGASRIIVDDDDFPGLGPLVIAQRLALGCNRNKSP